VRFAKPSCRAELDAKVACGEVHGDEAEFCFVKKEFRAPSAGA
jgi:hypothetical protein